MNDEEKYKIAEAIFSDMLNLLVSIGRFDNLSGYDKCLIAHNAIANLIGAYFAGLADKNDSEDEAINEPLAQLFKDAKVSFVAWRKIKIE